MTDNETPKTKRNYSKRISQAEAEAAFDTFFGAVLGLVVGLAEVERDTQLLGRPHSSKMCLCGKYCPFEHYKEQDIERPSGSGDEPGPRDTDTGTEMGYA